MYFITVGKLSYYFRLCPSLPVELYLNRQLRLAAGKLIFNSIPTPRSWKADSCPHTSPDRLLPFRRLGPEASAPPVQVNIFVYFSCLTANKQFYNNA
jgi:hypothetical protein